MNSKPTFSFGAASLSLFALLAPACTRDTATEPQEDHEEPASYILRGDVSLELQPGTTLDGDELASRHGYAASLTDTKGTPWLTRVERSTAEALLELGLHPVTVGEQQVFLGRIATELGDECHVLLDVDGARFVAMSRPTKDAACPADGDIAAWVPSATPIASDVPEGLGVAQQALAFGTKVGSFNGIDAYSNGSNSYYSGEKSCCGVKWQCVEYVNRFYKEALGHQNLIATGNANVYFETAANKGLVAFANPSPTKPAVGDMIASDGKPWGHVAIIREVGSNYIKVIHQNWANDASDDAKKLSMTYSNGKYFVGGFSTHYQVQGWMRRPVEACASVSSVTPSSAWLGNKTLFSVTGSCLPSSVAAWIDECADLKVESIGPAQATFSCTPSGSKGSKQGVIKTRAGGALLEAFAVDVL